MIKKIIFYISIISFVLLSFLVIEMLPFIYQSSWQGILFLLVVLITLIIELFIFIKNKEKVKKSILNNISIIIITMYTSFLYYNIYSFNNTLYTINIKYLKNNFLVLSIAFLFIMCSMLLNNFFDKEKKD